MNRPLIRLATPQDAEAIARLHVATSLAAYRPIFGEGYTGGDITERIVSWKRMLLGDLTLPWLPPEKTYVAEMEDGSIGGFCAAGASRDEDAGEDGEIHMLYVAPDYWRSGIGNALFKAGVSYLIERGFPQMVLWVLEGNTRARTFYEKHGWLPDGKRKPSASRPELSQVRYRFSPDET